MSFIHTFATKITAGAGAVMDLIRIAGNNVHSTGVNGTLPVEGTVADNGVADASFPLKVASVVRNVLTLYSDGDIAALISDVYGRVIVRPAGYDETEDALRTTNLNPDSTKVKYEVNADVTNGADNTYDYYVNLDDLGSITLRYALNGGTAGAFAGLVVTFAASIQDDGTVDSSLTYDDVTNDLIGAATLTCAAGASANGLIVDDGGVLQDCHVLRIRVVSVSSGGNTADWKFTSRQTVRL